MYRTAVSAALTCILILAGCSNRPELSWEDIKRLQPTRPAVYAHPTARPGYLDPPGSTRASYTSWAAVPRGNAPRASETEGASSIDRATWSAMRDEPRPQLQTPSYGSDAWVKNEAANEQKERRIDRLIKHGICRGC
jgi:hypothetical protein